MSKMGQYAMENESGQETPEMEEYAYWRIYNDARFLGYPNEFHDQTSSTILWKILTSYLNTHRTKTMRIGELKESKYLKKEDVGQGKLLTIRELKQENVAGDNQPEEIKGVMYFNEVAKGVVMNWTNLQLTAQACGSEETDDWPGKQVVLYEDPNISFGGKLVGGIRIRAPKQQATTGSASSGTGKEAIEQQFDDDIPF